MTDHAAGDFRRTGARVRSRCALFLCMLVLSVSGCSTGRLPGGLRQTAFDELHLIGTSLALDLDSKPGPDGVGVRIYATTRRGREAVRIQSGTLELLLFDGTIAAGEITATPPLRVWSYTAAELRQHEQETSVGVSYAFVPLWGDSAPKRNRITVAARYTNQPGTLIYSAPISVALAAR